jgi:hypothetical protein
VTPEYARVLETDNATGEQRYVVNMGATYSGSFTREQAERAVAWREKNITGRYRYEIVPVEPWMSDNGNARERHDEGHGNWPMEECGDPACREATTRLLSARLDEEAEQT